MLKYQKAIESVSKEITTLSDLRDWVFNVADVGDGVKLPGGLIVSATWKSALFFNVFERDDTGEITERTMSSNDLLNLFKSQEKNSVEEDSSDEDNTRPSIDELLHTAGWGELDSKIVDLLKEKKFLDLYEVARLFESHGKNLKALQSIKGGWYKKQLL